MVLLASVSQAALIVSGDISGQTFTCVDNDPNCDTNLAPKVLQLADQTINGVQVNGSIQTSQAGAVNTIDTSSLSIVNVSGQNRTITFTVGDTSFQGPVDTFVTSGSGTFQGPVGSNVTLTWFNDPNNVQGGESAGDTPGTPVDTFAVTQTIPISQSFSHNNSGPVADPADFSMTLYANGTLLPGATLLSRGQTETKFSTVIPEPSSLALLGGSLLLTGLILRRKPQEEEE